MLSEYEQKIGRSKFFNAGIRGKLLQAPPVTDYAKEGEYIYGSIGVGKTWRMAGICKAIADNQGVNCKVPKFISSQRIFSDIFKAMDAYGESAEDIADELIARPVLMIDDIGKEKPSEYVLSKLFQIVDERVLNGRPTFYTSNFSLIDLTERFAGIRPITAAALADRIGSSVKMVEMKGESRRWTS